MELNESDYNFLESIAEELLLIDADVYLAESKELRMIIRKLKRED